MKKPCHSHPHRSTTHQELYFHIFWDSSATVKGYKGATVFFRKEDNGHWYASVALCAPMDQFSRSKGRSCARRKYFSGRGQGSTVSYGIDKPIYDSARSYAIVAADIR